MVCFECVYCNWFKIEILGCNYWDLDVGLSVNVIVCILLISIERMEIDYMI